MALGTFPSSAQGPVSAHWVSSQIHDSVIGRQRPQLGKARVTLLSYVLSCFHDRFVSLSGGPPTPTGQCLRMETESFLSSLQRARGRDGHSGGRQAPPPASPCDPETCLQGEAGSAHWQLRPLGRDRRPLHVPSRQEAVLVSGTLRGVGGGGTGLPLTRVCHTASVPGRSPLSVGASISSPGREAGFCPVICKTSLSTDLLWFHEDGSRCAGSVLCLPGLCPDTDVLAGAPTVAYAHRSLGAIEETCT